MTKTHLYLALHQDAIPGAVKALFTHILPTVTLVLLLCTTGGLCTPGQSLMQGKQLAIKTDLAILIAIF